ncbi:MAG: restriction endonuclease [Bacteroidia bacterium]|nr:restriction endonuclease [Bacteroidia bacterium]
MPAQYDFATLGPDDFELLVRDLLNARENANGTGIEFQSFKGGRDGGIDLLYSTPANDHEIVVQIKHYLKSGIPALIRVCGTATKKKKSEADKVRILNPGKYILATSVELSTANKTKLKAIFDPYIKALDDVIGNEDLNKWLGDFPDVEKNHYKLWLASTTVLERIIRTVREGRSEYEAGRIKDNIALYVRNRSLRDAFQILQKEKVLIISGEPGCGKSTLADMIAFHLIGQGYEFNFIYQDPSDIEAKLRNDISKQLFYFDDFLGAISESREKAAGAESTLVPIIKRIKSLQNKKLILTTRKHILNEFSNRSEKIKRIQLQHGEYLLELNNLEKPLRLKMLINHCSVHALPEEYTEIITRKDLAEYIVDHSSFTPRFIDIFTDSNYLKKVAPEAYEEFIKANLENPYEVWGYAFSEQIGEEERFLLLTLFTFGSKVLMSALETAYIYRLEWEVANHGYTKKDGAFLRALKNLENGFITISEKNGRKLVAFKSPAIEDFLKAYFVENQDVLLSGIESSHFIEQYQVRFMTQFEDDLQFIPTDYSFRRLTGQSDKPIVGFYGENQNNLMKIYILTRYFQQFPLAEQFIIDLVKKADFEYMGKLPAILIQETLMAIDPNSDLGQTIKENIKPIHWGLLARADDKYSLEKHIGLITRYNFRCYELYDPELEGEDKKEIEAQILDIVNSHIISETDWLWEFAEDQGEVWDNKEEMEAWVEHLEEEFGLELEPEDWYYDNKDWPNIVLDNHIKRLTRDDKS